MTTFLLLLIVAILLFGSSIVIGTAGRILGAIVAVVAIIWAATALSISPIGLALTALAIVVALGVANYILQQVNKTADPDRPATPAPSASGAYRTHGADIAANRKFRDKYLADDNGPTA